MNVSVIGKNVGALAGSVISGNISNAYAAGNVHGGSDVGGLAGRNYGNISNAYATGKVSGTSYASGLVLADYGKINNSYWNTTSSAMATSVGGTGLTDTQMKQQASFSGWDFTNIWQINKGISYPTLKAFNQQTVAPVIPTPFAVLTPTVIVPTIVETKVVPVQPTITPVQSVDSVTLDEPILTPVQPVITPEQSVNPLIFDEPILTPVQLVDSLTLNQLMAQFSSIQTSTTFADWYYQQRLAKYNKEIGANFEQYKSLVYILLISGSYSGTAHS